MYKKILATLIFSTSLSLSAANKDDNPFGPNSFSYGVTEMLTGDIGDAPADNPQEQASIKAGKLKIQALAAVLHIDDNLTLRDAYTARLLMPAGTSLNYRNNILRRFISRDTIPFAKHAHSGYSKLGNIFNLLASASINSIQTDYDQYCLNLMNTLEIIVDDNTTPVDFGLIWIFLEELIANDNEPYTILRYNPKKLSLFKSLLMINTESLKLLTNFLKINATTLVREDNMKNFISLIESISQIPDQQNSDYIRQELSKL